MVCFGNILLALLVQPLSECLRNSILYPADAYTGRDLSLFATINKQELLLLIRSFNKCTQNSSRQYRYI